MSDNAAHRVATVSSHSAENNELIAEDDPGSLESSAEGSSFSLSETSWEPYHVLLIDNLGLKRMIG